MIDFVGNHRVFLDRVRLLVSLGRRPVSLREFLVDGKEPELPPGCSVDVELEAIDMLRHLLPSGATEAERAYRDLVTARGERPTAAELYRLGYPATGLRILAISGCARLKPCAASAPQVTGRFASRLQAESGGDGIHNPSSQQLDPFCVDDS